MVVTYSWEPTNITHCELFKGFTKLEKGIIGDNNTYYTAEPVFVMRLVNLQSVTCYTGQNFKEKAQFRALNLFTPEKRLKLSFKMSINLEDLDFDFVLQHFKLCLFVNEGDEEPVTRNLTEEDSSQCLKILS